MTIRPRHLTPAQQADVARVVRAMRAHGMLWKQIEAELGLCQRHLRRVAQMSDISAQMSDRASCANARAA